MQIIFELDTTWHTIHGTVKKVSGTVSLASPKDSRVIAASLSIPVSALDTDSESRDEEMHDCMESTKFPTITIDMPRITPSCTEKELASHAPCSYSTTGAVTIRDVTLPLALAGSITQDASGTISVSGSTHLDWSKFGVKDPSILVAKVNEDVRISFNLGLPVKSKR